MCSRFFPFTARFFLTDNGLYPHWNQRTSRFQHGAWKGRRDNAFPEETAHQILHAFLAERARFFSVFYRSDYKTTYYAPAFFSAEGGIFLKYYEVERAPVKIRLRNILRRTLARKGLNLYYPLEQKRIAAVRPLFYSAAGRGPIAREAVFCSLASPSNQTVKTLLRSDTRETELRTMAAELGTYLGRMNNQGVLFGELSRNILARQNNGRWEFVLCDLDELRSVSGITERKRKKYLEELRRGLSRKSQELLRVFDAAYEASYTGNKTVV